MPILKNAKKALRRDKRRTIVNLKVKNRMKLAIKQARESHDSTKLPAAYQAIDRATKKNLLHKNKAARLKSQLAQATKPETKPKSTTTKPSLKKSAKPKTKPTPTKKSPAKK